MKRILKTVLFFLLTISVVCMQISAVSNAYGLNLDRRWTNVEFLDCYLNFHGTQATYNVFVGGNTDVTNITATATLYYKNSSGSWVEIPKDWSYDVDDNILTINETFTAVSGREYKVEFEATVSTPDYDEPVQDTQVKTCP